MCSVFVSGGKYVTWWHHFWPPTNSLSRKRSFAIISWCRKKDLPMSLVEDFLYVVRIVLEYFGVPPDMVSAQTYFYWKYDSDCQTGSQRCPDAHYLCQRNKNSSGFTSHRLKLTVPVSFLYYSCFQCGTVSCVVSIAALCG